MSALLNGGLLAGRYRLESRIAAGGMGEVWRAADLVLGRPVAVKLLPAGYAQHPETLARFRAEARHAAAVSHPGIAQVYDYGDASEGQPPFLVMELVDGRPLTQLLAAGPLGQERTLDLIAQVAAGLAAAHAAGLVHRDIKAGNLLVSAGGTVKITDFGIAYAAGSAPLTRTGTVIGTPAYLAPERLAGAVAGPASDLYSLGIVAYECLAGAVPFAGTAMEVALAHQHQPLPPLPVPQEVATLIADLTAREPADRPASAADVAARAAWLRDRLSSGELSTGADTHPDRRLASPAGPSDADHPTLRTEAWPAAAADAWPAPPGDAGPPPPAEEARSRRLAASRTAGLLAVVIALAAGAGWRIAGGSGAASPAPSSPATSPAAGRFVEVNSAALTGRPARAVARLLRRSGLLVTVTRQPTRHAVPGTVLRVYPAGHVRAGSPVTIVVAVVSGRDHGHGHDQGHGHGQGNGNGQGGD
jgi:eukaryotic-like serine/threonine-protein kinase